MRFLRRNNTETAESDDTVDEAADAVSLPKGYTPKKGRETPRRRDAEARKRGPVAPAPRTTKEAIRRSRELRKQNPVSKDERRAIRRERHEKMMAGDDEYLLPRDRGPVKAYVRDVIDSRRNLLGLFMPLVLVVFAGSLVRIPMVSAIFTLASLLILIIMVIEAVLMGRRITRRARAKFPDETITGVSVGWYAFVRASQIRKLRMPKPRVKPGNKIE